MSSNNVVAFPKPKRNSPPQTMDEMLSSVDSVREMHIHSIADEVIEFALIRSYEEGFQVDNPDIIKSVNLVYDSVIAVLNRAVDIPHALHEVADNFYVGEPIEEETEQNDGN